MENHRDEISLKIKNNPLILAVLRHEKKSFDIKFKEVVLFCPSKRLRAKLVSRNLFRSYACAGLSMPFGQFGQKCLFDNLKEAQPSLS